MSQSLTCFKAYDIRGQLGEELNSDIAYRVGRAYGEFLQPQSVVVGGDIRLTTEELKLALAEGLRDAGVNVLDIGVSGTEEIYFATFHLGLDGGIEVLPAIILNYNGMKLVRSQAKPITVIPVCAIFSAWRKITASLRLIRPSAVATKKYRLKKSMWIICWAM